jgi:predicted phosphoribosyltransferase
MIFTNRNVAAELLLKRLSGFRNKNVIVAGIPRGAMPMAKVIADGLHGELTALLVHKISSPENEEFAIGCVGLSGHIHFLSHGGKYGLTKSSLDELASDELRVLKKRQERYGLGEMNFQGKTVIIVDDGIATGATIQCAIHEVRSQLPKKIIVATPVASSDAFLEIESLVDELIVLYVPTVMFSIGEFYEHFPQISDYEIMNILHPSKNIPESLF